MPAVIEAEELRKRYGPVAAVDGVSCQVAEREVFGIVGRNGAGKTTTVERSPWTRPGPWSPGRARPTSTTPSCT